MGLLASNALKISGNRFITNMSDVISRVAEETITIGKMVSLGAGPDSGIKHPSSAEDVTDATKVLGVAMHELRESKLIDEIVQQDSTDVVNILHSGFIWVDVENAVTPANDVYVRYAETADTAIRGSFGSRSIAAQTAKLPRARYLSSAPKNGRAILEVNL